MGMFDLSIARGGPRAAGFPDSTIVEGSAKEINDLRECPPMHQTVSIDMQHDVLKANAHVAEHNHERLELNDIRSFDFMGGIGSGKTLLIEKLAAELQRRGLRVGAIAGDVAGDDDFRRMNAAGIDAVNLNTVKECHLDANLVEKALMSVPVEDIDVLFIENVGNLVCPADFPLGTDKRVIVISVTEGDDMVRKHPLIFHHADVIVINKIDIAEHVDVDPEVIVRDAKEINPHVPVILTDAKHGVGVDALLRALGY